MASEEEWYFDSVPLKRFDRIIEVRDGWDDTPGIRGSNTVLFGKHGTSWRPKKYDEGKKTIVVGVHGILDEFFTAPADPGDERALLERNLDELLRMVSIRHRLISVERILATGDRRRADCEIVPSAPALTGNGYAQVTLSVSIPSSFWEDSDPYNYGLPYDIATGGAQSLEVYSLAGQDGYCSDAVVTVTGPFTSVTIRDDATGSGFTYAGSVSGGQTLTVDAGEYTADVDGTSVITDLVLYDGQIMEIAPAPSSGRGPSVTVTTAGTSAGFVPSMTTRRKWLR